MDDQRFLLRSLSSRRREIAKSKLLRLSLQRWLLRRCFRDKLQADRFLLKCLIRSMCLDDCGFVLSQCRLFFSSDALDIVEQLSYEFLCNAKK